MLIICKSRKDLVKKQRAVIDYVYRRSDYNSTGVQEAIQDFQRWSKESGEFKDLRIDDDTGKPLNKGCRWITTFEKRGGGIRNGRKETKEKQENKVLVNR